jgi:murein DD-endopeptidase MepM/ murein hydrolase activator NlpD
MMTRDDRFYAFIVARTSRSRAHIRRICVHKRWLKASAAGLFVILCGLIYGFYGLTQQAEHLRIEHENRQLRAENDKQRQQLQNLNNRVDAVEDASRKLAEVSGMDKDAVAPHGQGGPARPVNSAAALAALEAKTARLEREMRMYEAFLRSRGVSRGVIPSIWPVYGKLESGVGGRRNPFTGRGHEYHEGQDIDAAWGTPVEAAAAGKVIIAGREATAMLSISITAVGCPPAMATSQRST